MKILHKIKITAAILLVLTSLAARALDAPSAIVPAGLSPGDEFYIIFPTSTTIAATSTDIATYNTHVNAAADLSSVKGTDDPSIVWKALVGTLGGGDQCDIYNSADDDIPVYNTIGEKVADDWLAMFDDLDERIKYTETGSVPASTVTWTGCTKLGGVHATRSLGSSDSEVGFSDNTLNEQWIDVGYDPNTAELYHVYAVSPKLTVAAPVSVTASPMEW